ncbi:pilus assembly protein PilC [candidate division BRC1 bacterium HGW-BRC1-1]|jgi:type IV pilus assembly protein PilC|nr:MAG: pilus assembly protein PilC [candidate division BRC1 bacterium HGW-BRC1-1]
MASFTYVARNPQGKLVQGRTEAATQAIALKTLKDQGLVPTSIQTASTGAETKSKARKQKLKRGRTNIEDLVLIARQLATMIRAGLPLTEVLNILSEQVEKLVLRNTIRQIERDVQSGSSFYEALARHPKVFNQFFLSMVKAGEAAGMLDTILDQVAIYLEKSASIRRKVKSAIMYPAAVSIFAALIMVVIMWKVVPVFEEIFDQLDEELPLLTQVVIAISNFIRDRWYIVLAGGVGIVVLFTQWGKTKVGRMRIDAMKLKLPVFGPLLLKVSVAKFSRSLGTLMRAGVNILGALEIVAKTAGNVVIEDAILKTKVSIQGGDSITKPLVDSGVFPPMVTRMIEVGERTGALESMLHKIAEYYEDQVDSAVAGLTSLIEPLLIMFLGVTIGGIVIAMFMPLFTMLEAVGKPAK